MNRSPPYATLNRQLSGSMPKKQLAARRAHLEPVHVPVLLVAPESWLHKLRTSHSACDA